MILCNTLITQRISTNAEVIDMQTKPELFSTNEAAQYLGFKSPTLRNARHSGRLAGVDAPPYRKMGSAVRYDRAALDRWLSQFAEQTSTAQSA